jgi:myo-inositol 2-dehydrogenase/D-chiro-inositol 1-dehydrogenase
VFILTPDHLHAPLLERSMRAGKHVFIEKPAALTAAELRAAGGTRSPQRKVVFVGYMRRFAPAFTSSRSGCRRAGKSGMCAFAT